MKVRLVVLGTSEITLVVLGKVTLVVLGDKLDNACGARRQGKACGATRQGKAGVRSRLTAFTVRYGRAGRLIIDGRRDVCIGGSCYCSWLRCCCLNSGFSSCGQFGAWQRCILFGVPWSRQTWKRFRNRRIHELAR